MGSTSSAFVGPWIDGVTILIRRLFSPVATWPGFAEPVLLVIQGDTVCETEGVARGGNEPHGGDSGLARTTSATITDELSPGKGDIRTALLVEGVSRLERSSMPASWSSSKESAMVGIGKIPSTITMI